MSKAKPATALLHHFPSSPWVSPPLKEGAMQVSLSKMLAISGFVQHLLKLNEGRELPSLEVFKVMLDGALCNLM